MDALEELERVQIQILRRITQLELRLLPQQFSTALSVSSDKKENCNDSISSVTNTESQLSEILRANGVRDFLFKRVPSDYYDRSLEDRREILGASSIDHLCKSIVLVNTQAQGHVTDCSDRNNSKYYIVVSEACTEESSSKLTGYEHNGVACIGMKTDIPVILDEAIANLNPDFFWLGGGEIDLKLGIRTPQLINFVKPFIFSCSST